ncbi:ROK family protein [Nocardioides mesophilus]|uniref:ROK family protein n=1 Tax=Nocardioides mesophilus TaxID=433659 RepID=A0A7G9RG68_9ACTN|nr:ROK family protein [Nocardioides mesophilus]QNN54593.1 ROK family protein [Nocardioides mesophilus]
MSSPPYAGTPPVVAGPGDLLDLIRSGRAGTRADLRRLTGLSRTAVSARLDALAGLGLVQEGGTAESTGGRPPARLSFHRQAGVVLAVAIGRSRVQLAVCDLSGAVLAAADVDQEVGAGPDQVMPRVVAVLRDLLDEAGRGAGDVRAFGVSIPGTVDRDRGVSHDSQLMTGWDGVPLSRWLTDLAAAPVLVDNDAAVLALSEQVDGQEGRENLLALKVSTGLGAGIVADGRLVRGGRGAAGEIGHVKTVAAEGRTCRCGEVGCLEAVAGGWALVEAMREQGREVGHIRDLVALAVEGDAEARRLIRESGRRYGEVLGAVVTILNPDVLVIGGDVLPAYETFVAGMRETVYAQGTALATKDLRIEPARHGEQAGLVGCAAMALEEILNPRAVDLAVSRAD